MSRQLRSMSSSSTRPDPPEMSIELPDEVFHDEARCGNDRCRWKTVNTRGVFCKTCKRWYHYSCAQTLAEAINPFPQGTPFVCPRCTNDKSSIDAPVVSKSPVSTLPGYVKCKAKSFTWGVYSAIEMTTKINAAYERIVFWKKNLLKLPTCSAAKLVVAEMTRLLNEWNDCGRLEHVAMRALMIMPALLMQKPSKKSKTKDHIKYLEDRFCKWKDGDIDVLLREGESIQSNLVFTSNRKKGGDDVMKQNKLFSKHALQGNNSIALRILEDSDGGGVLEDTPETLQLLKEKHPQLNHSNSRPYFVVRSMILPR